MKVAKLLHNPQAGDEEHSKKELIALIEANGFKCKYASTKRKGWKDIDPEVDFLIAAGGDGTVRKIIKRLLRRKVLQKTWPIALLPLGTANNIAKTLGITGTSKEIIRSWHQASLKKFDVGKIYNLPEANFFLEGFGYGVFPYLIMEMQKQEAESIGTPEQKIQIALELLHQIVLGYEPRQCHLEVDGTNHSGKFLLAEIMNIASIGPNLFLSPHSDAGDGELEVVLVPESHKDRFAAYVAGKLSGVEEPYTFSTLKAKNILISWEGTHIHIDGEVIKTTKSNKIRIELKAGLVDFLVP